MCRTFYRRQIFADFCTRGKTAHHRVPVAFKTLRKRRVNFNRVVKRDHALHNMMLLSRQNPAPNIRTTHNCATHIYPDGKTTSL